MESAPVRLVGALGLLCTDRLLPAWASDQMQAAAATIVQKHFRGRQTRLDYPWWTNPTAFSRMIGRRRDGAMMIDGEVVLFHDPRSQPEREREAEEFRKVEEAFDKMHEQQMKKFHGWASFIRPVLKYDNLIDIKLELNVHKWGLVDGKPEPLWVKVQIAKLAPISDCPYRIVRNAVRNLSITSLFVFPTQSPSIFRAPYPTRAYYCMFVVLRDYVLLKLHRFDQLPIDVVHKIVSIALDIWCS